MKKEIKEESAANLEFLRGLAILSRRQNGEIHYPAPDDKMAQPRHGLQVGASFPALAFASIKGRVAVDVAIRL